MLMTQESVVKTHESKVTMFLNKILYNLTLTIRNYSSSVSSESDFAFLLSLLLVKEWIEAFAFLRFADGL